MWFLINREFDKPEFHCLWELLISHGKTTLEMTAETNSHGLLNINTNVIQILYLEFLLDKLCKTISLTRVTISMEHRLFLKIRQVNTTGQ